MKISVNNFYKVTYFFEQIENFDFFDDAISVAVVSQQELPKFLKTYFPDVVFPRKDKNLRLTRALEFNKFTYCSLSIPLKKKYKLKHSAKFSILIMNNALIFVTHNEHCKQLLKKFNLHKMKQSYSIELILYLFFENVIENDLVFLEECERRLMALEELAFNKDVENFDRDLINVKSQLLYLTSFYTQFTGLLIKLKHNDKNYFTNTNYFSQTNERLALLLNLSQMLKEHSVQIKDLYQSQIDAKQNNTMKFLTAVTTIFLPLTLIVGWYGMNFEHMPELSWQYGYLTVIVASITVASICIFIFKKKNWF